MYKIIILLHYLHYLIPGVQSNSIVYIITGVFFLFGVEESIVNAPPDYNFDQLFKSNLTFCVVCVFNLQFVKSVF
jgi:hypothetical protein